MSRLNEITKEKVFVFEDGYDVGDLFKNGNMYGIFIGCDRFIVKVVESNSGFKVSMYSNIIIDRVFLDVYKKLKKFENVNITLYMDQINGGGIDAIASRYNIELLEGIDDILVARAREPKKRVRDDGKEKSGEYNEASKYILNELLIEALRSYLVGNDAKIEELNGKETKYGRDDLTKLTEVDGDVRDAIELKVEKARLEKIKKKIEENIVQLVDENKKINKSVTDEEKTVILENVKREVVVQFDEIVNNIEKEASIIADDDRYFYTQIFEANKNAERLAAENEAKKAEEEAKRKVEEAKKAEEEAERKAEEAKRKAEEADNAAAAAIDAEKEAKRKAEEADNAAAAAMDAEEEAKRKAEEEAPKKISRSMLVDLATNLTRVLGGRGAGNENVDRDGAEEVAAEEAAARDKAAAEEAAVLKKKEELKKKFDEIVKEYNHDMVSKFESLMGENPNVISETEKQIYEKHNRIINGKKYTELFDGIVKKTEKKCKDIVSSINVGENLSTLSLFDLSRKFRSYQRDIVDGKVFQDSETEFRTELNKIRIRPVVEKYEPNMNVYDQKMKQEFESIKTRIMVEIIGKTNAFGDNVVKIPNVMDQKNWGKIVEILCVAQIILPNRDDVSRIVKERFNSIKTSIKGQMSSTPLASWAKITNFFTERGFSIKDEPNFKQWYGLQRGGKAIGYKQFSDKMEEMNIGDFMVPFWSNIDYLKLY